MGVGMNEKWERALAGKGPLGPLKYMAEHFAEFLPPERAEAKALRQRLTALISAIELQTDWILKEKAAIESRCLKVQRLAETAKRVGVKSLIDGDLTIVLEDK